MYKPTIRIMMATYNGEKYLAEQIESIINQTYSNWSMVIQDDNSTDGTWNVLRRYAVLDSRISIRKSPENNHGAYYNFNSVANQEKKSGRKFDYYMFSDQDDIWDSDKIEKLVKFIQDKEDDKPIVVYGDLRVIDQNGNVFLPSAHNAFYLHYQNKYSLFFGHIIHGCNMIMNRKNFEIVPIIDTNEKIVKILAHDALYAEYAGMAGYVYCYPLQTMSYRRHENNVTPTEVNKFNIKRVIKRIIRLNELSRDHALCYNQSLYAIKLMGNCQQIDQHILNEMETAIRKGGPTSINFIRKYKVNWENSTKNISHKLILFLGLHKRFLTE